MWCASFWTTQKWPPRRLLINPRANIGRRRISARSIAEQLGISRERVGSIIFEDLNMRKLSASEQHLEFFSARSKLFPVAIGDHGRNLVIIQWSGGIAAHPAPKKFRVQNSAGKVIASIFGGIKTASSPLIIFQRAKLSTRSITYLCWCNWRTFWLKNAAGSSARESCSCTKMPRVTGHLQPEETGLPGLSVSWSPYSPDLAPSDYHLFPGLKKTIESSPLFVGRGVHCCRGDLVGRTTFWILFF